ncbi:MAG TPA: hypothetical protein VKB93_05935 [Thermoanaerobaculia bacterium]|nr:hypothetical protein [Thermoanaerobaculia bacterium]
MFEVIGQILLELIVEMIGEGVIDAISHAAGDSHRWAAAAHVAAYVFIYGMIGAVVGAASLLIVPAHFIRHATIRVVALFVIPVTAGVVFSLVGRRRRWAGKPVSALEAFVPAFAFAFAMSAVRYVAAT